MATVILRDLEMGLINEIKLLPKLQNYFKDNTIEKIDIRHCPFDYQSADCLYELKTRRCKRCQYPTTIFPTSKFKFIPDKKKILIFDFIDGTYFIEYNILLFDTFKKETKRFRYDRPGVDKPVEYIYIPSDLLSPLS